MRLLLDTHILLWAYVDTEKLSVREHVAIGDPGNQIFANVVNLWEIAIKTTKGQLNAPADLMERVQSNPDLILLPVLAEHAWRVRTLPRLHGDPFDHLLVAQAQCENLTVVTRDAWIGRYGVAVFAA